jgi:hypothetical protein
VAATRTSQSTLYIELFNSLFDHYNNLSWNFVLSSLGFGNLCCDGGKTVTYLASWTGYSTENLLSEIIVSVDCHSGRGVAYLGRTVGGRWNWWNFGTS